MTERSYGDEMYMPVYRDDENSWGFDSVQTLNASQTLTGTPNNDPHAALMVCGCVVGGDATLYVDYSWDGGSNYDLTKSWALADSTPVMETVDKGYCVTRVRVTAGGSNLTHVRIITQYGMFIGQTVADSSNTQLVAVNVNITTLNGKIDTLNSKIEDVKTKIDATNTALGGTLNVSIV